MRNFYRAPALFLSFLLVCHPAGAYSLLTHEQLIDLTWQSSIVPLLRSRYPNITPEQLEQARSYAYAGCVIQDIGYYPFGDPFFSDLTHYVRSGDFVVHLFRDAKDANQLAFAVGALSHYIGDNIGHSQATNRAVPVEFPKLAAKYGPVVTYGEGATCPRPDRVRLRHQRDCAPPSRARSLPSTCRPQRAHASSSPPPSTRPMV